MVVSSTPSTSYSSASNMDLNERSSLGASSLMSKAAHDQASKIIERTAVFDESAEAEIPRFKRSEIALGRVIARGGFSVVQEVSAIKIPELKRSGGHGFKKPGKKQQTSSSRVKQKGSASPTPLSSISGDHVSDALEGTMSREVIGRRAAGRGKAKFVIKSLPNSSRGNFDEGTYVKAMVDICMEAKFLASLCHPHIVPLRGMSEAGAFDLDGSTDSQFFLLLDRLPHLLMSKIREWSNTDRACRGVTGRLTGGKARKQDLLVERLQVAHDLADVLDFLHGRDLVFRDFKPDNIGFNSHGKVNLFDFGLCRQLCARDRIEGCEEGEEVYRMTGCTGAIRYMAPEVGLDQPYGKKIDVYSFGMVLWFMMALEPPFACYTPDMLPSRVFEKGHRPFIMAEWSTELARLIKRCWDAQPHNRPSFQRIKKSLREQIRYVAPDVALIMKQGEEESGSISIDVSNKSQ